MKYKTIVTFKDGRQAELHSKKQLTSKEWIDRARALFKEAGLDHMQPIVSITPKKKFLFLYI